MKKTILSLMLLIVTCSVFGKNANDLIKHYKKMDGAKYVNATNAITGITKFMNESDRDMLLTRVEKLETVELLLDKEEMKNLHEDIMDLKGYQLYYSEANNEHRRMFPLIRLYGMEKNGKIKDAIIHMGIIDSDGVTSYIIHVTGEFSLKQLIDKVEFKQKSKKGLTETRSMYLLPAKKEEKKKQMK